MLNISVYIDCVICCSCFSQLSLLVLLYFLYFSVFLLLLQYVKLGNSFYYELLVKVCMFLIIFIFIIFSVLVYIIYFCCSCRKKMHFYDIMKKNGWWLDNCPIHFKPMIYKRYIEDIFVLFSSKEHLQLFVYYMNNSINF